MRQIWCGVLCAMWCVHGCGSGQEATTLKGPPKMAPAHVCTGQGDDGLACDDGDPCTAHDVCLTGSCSGAPLSPSSSCAARRRRSSV